MNLKPYLNLTGQCDRKVTSLDYIRAEVKAITKEYNLEVDVPCFESKDVFDFKTKGDDILLNDFSDNFSYPDPFTYMDIDGTLYFVDPQGYRYMRYIAKVVK